MNLVERQHYEYFGHAGCDPLFDREDDLLIVSVFLIDDSGNKAYVTAVGPTADNAIAHAEDFMGGSYTMTEWEAA